MQVRVSETLGTHAVAASSFNTGDLVLSEDALLRVPEPSSSLTSEMERRYGERAAFLAPIVSIDWSRVDEEVRQAALTLFFVHPLMKRKKGPIVSDSLKVCEDLRSWHEPLKGRWEAEDIVKFLHIVDLNIHRDNEEPTRKDFTGIFVLGSKFSHSCAPNCSWSFSAEGQLQYHAIRPIAPGELFTFSYVGNGMNAITSTLERRRRLAALWFVCQCSRCKGPDLSRQMRCPSCSLPQCLPVFSESGSSWSGERPLRETIVDASSWKCACGWEGPSAQLPVRDEEELGRLIPEAMQGSPEQASQDIRVLWKLRERSARTLGTQHWTWMLASFAWLQKCLVQLQNDTVFEHSEQELRRASTDVASWLAACAPDNTEQRLSALFITTRLAYNLGGGLQLWGYDRAQPLGQVNALDRLAANGWKLVEDGVEGPDELGASWGQATVRNGPATQPPKGAPKFCGMWR